MYITYCNNDDVYIYIVIQVLNLQIENLLFAIPVDGAS